MGAGEQLNKAAIPPLAKAWGSLAEESMDKKVFLNYTQNGVLTDALSVTVTIVRNDNGVTVLSTTEANHDSTGGYSKTFTVDPNVVYTVTWIVTPSATEAPLSSVDIVGPFFDISKPVRAIGDFRGTFIQGTIGTLFLKIGYPDGRATDASQITLSITDQNGNPVRDTGNILLNNIIPEKITEGYYFFDWSITYNQPIGNYNVLWTYTADGSTGNEYQVVTVTDATNINGGSLYNNILIGFREALSNMLAIAQYVNVYNEQPKKISNDLKKYHFGFPRWLQNSNTQIYVNKTPVEGGITINYFKGHVEFDSPLTSFDTVTADYSFRWFSDEELDTFLSNAISRYNTTTPFTGATWNLLSSNWYPVILDLAASYAIRNLMMRLLTMEAKMVFGGPDAAKELFGQLDLLKKNYEEQAKQQLDNKKLGPYIGLTKFISVPEMTLPGGRSRWFRELFSGSGKG